MKCAVQKAQNQSEPMPEVTFRDLKMSIFCQVLSAGSKKGKKPHKGGTWACVKPSLTINALLNWGLTEEKLLENDPKNQTVTRFFPSASQLWPWSD